jgi:hypothetical protein
MADRKEYMAQYRAKNKERLTKYKHDWYAQNKDDIVRRRKERAFAQIEQKIRRET